MEPFADHPDVLGLTILNPYHESVSNRWLCDYEMKCIIPEGLTNRDLRTLPPKETVKKGPPFGKI